MTKGIGKIIKKNRLELNLTLEDVAKAVGVSKSTVHKDVHERLKKIKLQQIEILKLKLFLQNIMTN